MSWVTVWVSKICLTRVRKGVRKRGRESGTSWLIGLRPRGSETKIKIQFLINKLEEVNTYTVKPVLAELGKNTQLIWVELCLAQSGSSCVLDLWSISFLGLPIVLIKFSVVSNTSVLQRFTSAQRLFPIQQSLQTLECLLQRYE